MDLIRTVIIKRLSKLSLMNSPMLVSKFITNRRRLNAISFQTAFPQRKSANDNNKYRFGLPATMIGRRIWQKRSSTWSSGRIFLRPFISQNSNSSPYPCPSPVQKPSLLVFFSSHASSSLFCSVNKFVNVSFGN